MRGLVEMRPEFAVVFRGSPRWVLLLAVAVILLLAVGAPGASASACDTSWASPVSGDWSNPANWTAGVPNGNNACITAAGTYTVSIVGENEGLGANTSPGTLTLGASSGTQTLEIAGCDCSGDINSGILNVTGGGTVGPNGVIELTHTGTFGNNGGTEAVLDISGGTLRNAGTLETDAGTSISGDSARLDGSITNSGGTINIKTTTNYDEPQTFISPNANVLDNAGALNLADGTQLDVAQNTSTKVINDAGGTIANTGNRGAGFLFVDAGNTFDQDAGTTSPATANPANPVVYVNGSGTSNVALRYGGSGASAIVFRNHGTLSGNLASGQNLIIEATDLCGEINSTVATAGAGFTDAGQVTLTHVGTCGNNGGTTAELALSGGTLTNTGTLETDPGTSIVGDSARVDGSITNSGGTINVNTTTAFSGSGTTLTQTGGATTIASAQTLDLTGSTGTFELQRGRLNGSGTLRGSLNNSGGTVAPGASPGTLTVNGSYSQGASGTLEIAADGHSAGQFSVLTVNGNVTLAGTLSLAPNSNYQSGAAPGDTLGVISYTGSQSGTFATVNANPPFTAGKSVSADYSHTRVVNAVIGRLKPPNTEITEANIQSTKHEATFGFRAIGRADGFQCALVKHTASTPKPSFSACRSPKTYQRLTAGTYTFEVRAFNAGGADPTPAKKQFTIT